MKCTCWFIANIFWLFLRQNTGLNNFGRQYGVSALCSSYGAKLSICWVFQLDLGYFSWICLSLCLKYASNKNALIVLRCSRPWLYLIWLWVLLHINVVFSETFISLMCSARLWHKQFVVRPHRMHGVHVSTPLDPSTLQQMHGSLGPPESSSQRARRSHAPFLYSCRLSLYFIMRRYMSPQITPSPGWIRANT